MTELEVLQNINTKLTTVITKFEEQKIITENNLLELQYINWAMAFFIGMYVFFTCFKTLKTYVL